jgi:hypothetical protein
MAVYGQPTEGCSHIGDTCLLPMFTRIVAVVCRSPVLPSRPDSMKPAAQLQRPHMLPSTFPAFPSDVLTQDATAVTMDCASNSMCPEAQPALWLQSFRSTIDSRIKPQARAENSCGKYQEETVANTLTVSDTGSAGAKALARALLVAAENLLDASDGAPALCTSCKQSAVALKHVAHTGNTGKGQEYKQACGCRGAGQWHGSTPTACGYCGHKLSGTGKHVYPFHSNQSALQQPSVVLDVQQVQPRGANSVSSLTHPVERVVKQLRDGKRGWSSEKMMKRIAERRWLEQEMSAYAFEQRRIRHVRGSTLSQDSLDVMTPGVVYLDACTLCAPVHASRLHG